MRSSLGVIKYVFTVTCVVFCACECKVVVQDDHVEFIGSNVTVITSDMLQPYREVLKELWLNDLPDLLEIEEDTLRNLTLLQSLYIENVERLTHLPEKLFDPEPENLKSIHIIFSGLQEPPRMDSLTKTEGSSLHTVDLSNNKIKILKTRSIRVRTIQLILINNDIREIEDYAFEGSQLGDLLLKGNKKLTTLHDMSFAGILAIKKLDVSSTSILRLPTMGLATLEILYVQDNIHMKTIPSIHEFQNLQIARLTHSFHCCAFKFPDLHDPERHAQYLEIKENCSRGSQSGITKRSTNGYQENIGEMYASNGSHANMDFGWVDYDIDGGVFHVIDGNISDYPSITLCGSYVERSMTVNCTPTSDALNPCAGVLGSTPALVIGWMVGVVGSIANLLVIIVLIGRASFGPARLIHLQLALADFCTAGYLLLLASVDSHSSGSYFNFAYDWQYGAGCQVAGFFGVAGAQGSLLALAALTLERWLAITQALHVNRRLSPRAVKGLLLGAMAYSFLIAAMPFAGLSDYSSTSVCLPMRQRNAEDSVYLWTLLCGGCLAVFAVAACYIHIYVTLARDSRQCTSMSVEASVAHKMAILILIHMACVIPIGAVAAGALSGWSLVDVRGAKILMVVVYPLNAIADPFLYAILTHQFRKDLCLLLARFGICTVQAQRYKIPGACRAQLMRPNNCGKDCELRTNGAPCGVPSRSTTRSITTAYSELPV